MSNRLVGYVIFSTLFGLFAFSIDDAYSFQDSVAVDGFPRDIDIDYALNNLYVPNYDAGTVSVIDSQNMIVKDTIIINDFNSNPTRIDVDSNRNMVFVSDKISGTLTVIDGKTHKIIDSIKIGDSLWDLDVNEANGKLYVSDLLQNKIFVIDTKNMSVIKSIPVSGSPWSVTINQQTNMVYVASGTAELIHVIDGNSDDIIHELNPGKKPWGLSINEKSNVLYVTSWDSNYVTVIDLENSQILYEIPIVSGAWSMSTNQNNGVTVISNEHSNELYLLDKHSKHFQTITVLNSPQSLSASSYSNTVFVANPLSNTVSSVTYDYDFSEFTPIVEHVISDNNSVNDELILDVLEGMSEIPQRHEVDSDLISGLLQNIGITGDFDGNGIARILLDDYNERKELQQKSVPVPTWTVDLAAMFVDDKNYDIPSQIDCSDNSFEPIHDLDDANPYNIWLKILPLCALS